MSLEVTSLRALAHPVRLQMLSLLTGAAMSAAELARELELTQANASYHLRTLAAAGLVTAAGEERVRGGIARRYRYDVEAQVEVTAETGDDPLPHEVLAAELVRRAALRRPGRERTMTDAELWVEPQAWDQARSQVTHAMRDLHLAARPPRQKGTIRVSATVAMFRMVEQEPT